MDDPAFACDAALGGLARLLRFAGLDTLFDPSRTNVETAARARIDGRWMLTSDRRLAPRCGPRVLQLTGGDDAARFRYVVSRVNVRVDPTRFLTRCSRCNDLLVDCPAVQARDLVPPLVAARAPRFRRCPQCGRIYWRGTHAARIEDSLARLLTPP